MSPKVKYYVSSKLVRKARHMVNGYKMRYERMAMETGSGLPTANNPVVVRVVTRNELAAIPREHYDVKVIKVMVPLMQMGEGEGEEELLVAITSSEHLSRQLRVVRQRLRNSLRSNSGGGGAPPSGNPFKEPVDQYQMADSIIEVMEGFFHGEEKCDIYDMNFTKMEFCVMMHIFFKKIHFLKKETRLQFSKFLQNKVFAGKSGFIRSFNTYADKDIYKAFEEQLDIKQFNFFRNHPVPIPIEKKPSDYHQRMMLDMSTAFQEIGWAFQKSACFKKLKKLKETMNDFVLQ